MTDPCRMENRSWMEMGFALWKPGSSHIPGGRNVNVSFGE